LKVRKIVMAVFGLVATIVGWGMWREPQLDINILIRDITGEVYRLIEDPFAVLGLIIMLLGLWTIFKALTPDNGGTRGFPFDKEEESWSRRI